MAGRKQTITLGIAAAVAILGVVTSVWIAIPLLLIAGLLFVWGLWPKSIFKLGLETVLAKLSEGDRVSIPSDSVLTSLQLGVGRGVWGAGRWLVVASRDVEDVKLKLRGENPVPTIITAPGHDGGSAVYHVPQGTIVSALQLGSGPSLTIWYREVESPSNFQLGPEVKGMFSKEPPDNGGGARAHQDGYTITGFQWLKDAAPPIGGHVALHLWYRQVP
jgi:hypothetical protein